MKKESIQLAQYWRNNLTDVALQGGELDIDNLIEIDKNDWQQAQVPQVVLNRLFPEIDKTEDKKNNLQSLDLLVYASTYYRQSIHTKTKWDGIPSILSTVMVKVNVTNNGDLTAISNPYVPRVFLEPLEYTNFFIGSMEGLDSFVSSQNWTTPPSWTQMLDRCALLEENVCDIEFLKAEMFKPKEKVYFKIIDIKAMGANASMIKLYDTLLKDKKLKVPLFDSYASSNQKLIENVPIPEKTIILRSGHMDPIYSLAIAQRDALAVTLLAEEGEVIAVNGPPGTGKTTMLQSVTASLWTNAVVDGSDYPPVIVVASTNNQAVTNVIDSFSKVKERDNDLFSGRWLPDISSYGCYYPASHRSKDAREKGYQTEALWEHIESQTYVEKSKKHYLDLANQAYQKDFNTIDSVMAELKKSLKANITILNSAKNSWQKYLTAKEKAISLLGNAPSKKLEKLRADKLGAESKYNHLENINKNLFVYLSEESIWLLLLSFIPAVRYKRVVKALLMLKLDEEKDWHVETIAELQVKIKCAISLASDYKSEVSKQLQTAERLMNEYNKFKAEWGQTTKEVGLTSDALIGDFDAEADTSIRQTMFKLATHYWEGRWIQETSNTILNKDPDNAGVRLSERKWRRRAMVAPCSVMTLFRLPNLFTAWQGDDKPLYNFIDLLVIDEAGQVSPAVGGQAFAFAKRAIVVGDTMQIEPVKNCDLKSDAGNLAEAGYKESSYDKLEKTGRTVFNGNVMQVAQTSSKYHYDIQLARGMYLYEHRRCVDDIISYCNVLCYKDKLIPKRGNNQRGSLQLPRMGYIQISGESEKFGSSRRNKDEAMMLANYIVSITPQLLSAYPNQTLEKIIAVITPFAAQSVLIEKFLKDTPSKGITIGTVHRMQGAEYPIVLFSPTYCRKDGLKRMLDEKPNMLNVAVSRAQDSFIFVGDIHAFDQHATSPSGKLVKVLMSSQDNQINISNSELH